MGHNHLAGPSLFLAEHDAAHREHIHQHHILHNKRQIATEIATDSVVTEVVATISVVQQVNVDSNGSVIATQTVLTSANSTTAATTTDASAPSTSIDTGSAPTDSSSAAASSTTIEESSHPTTSQSFSSSSSILTASTSAPSPTTTFASLPPSTNSTTIISIPSSSVSSFSNSSVTSTVLLASSSTLSETPLLSAAATSVFPDDDAAESSTSFFYSPTYSPSQPTTSADAGIIAGGTGIGSGATSPSHTAGSGNGSGSGDGGSGSSAPSTPVVVGGVVGGVAGAAILIFLLMIIIRWKKRNSSMLSLGSSENPASSDAAGGLPPPPPVASSMVQRASRAFAIPAAFANLGPYNRSSQKTDRTVSTENSERGFYRVSGRKLEPIYKNRTNDYGDPLDDNALSESSFYRDSQGFYGGPGSPTSPGLMSMSTHRESGVPVMRPSPARTPVTEYATFPPVPAPLNIPKRPDVLGRSHPSQDGSHASRFTEEV